MEAEPLTVFPLWLALGIDQQENKGPLLPYILTPTPPPTQEAYLEPPGQVRRKGTQRLSGDLSEGEGIKDQNCAVGIFVFTLLKTEGGFENKTGLALIALQFDFRRAT